MLGCVQRIKALLLRLAREKDEDIYTKRSWKCWESVLISLVLVDGSVEYSIVWAALAKVEDESDVASNSESGINPSTPTTGTSTSPGIPTTGTSTVPSLKPRKKIYALNL